MISVDTKVDLVINQLTEEQFLQLSSENKIDDNQLYLVNDSSIDANWKRILNAAEPVNDGDVATKHYVDTHPGAGGTPQAALIYDAVQDLTDQQKTQLGVNGGYRYKLINGQLQHGTITIPNSIGQMVQKTCDYITVEDFAVTTITISSMNDVVIFLPAALDNRCRDLILKVKIETETAPQIQFLATSGEPIDFESDDDSWGNLEPGINFMLFTETERVTAPEA